METMCTQRVLIKKGSSTANTNDMENKLMSYYHFFETE